jgi:DNA-binding response OmpR family regulator
MMRILLLNLSMDSIQEVKQALSGQGYEIITGRSSTVDESLALSPDVLITEATPSDLSCCSLMSQIKAAPHPRTLKIVMIVHGGALERARALDLLADDVISFPFEPLEFAAKIRTQFRERQPELELEARLNDALQKEHLAERAVEALSAGMNSKRRMWLIPAVVLLSVAVVLAAFTTVFANRHGRKATRQLQAEVARLNGGILQQGELLRRVEQARASMTEVVSQLATRRLIRPTTTQGHIGDVLKDKIVYDAATTSGGSGGPLFNHDGKVIGVNFAVLNDFGGSNLAIPIRYADELVR